MLTAECGFRVEPAEPITCQQPVANKGGILKKKTTIPDFKVSHPHTGHFTLVEVTADSILGSGKAAQRRVVTQAEHEQGIAIPYVVVCGTTVAQLTSLDVETRTEFLLGLFKWQL